MYALFGLSPIAWHLVTLLLRWARRPAVLPILKETLAAARWLSPLAGRALAGLSGLLPCNRSPPHYSGTSPRIFLFMLSVYLMVLAVQQPRQRVVALPALVADCFHSDLYD